jgi:hypothetical protein
MTKRSLTCLAPVARLSIATFSFLFLVEFCEPDLVLRVCE